MVPEPPDEAPSLPGTVLLYSHSWLPGQVDGVAVRMMAHAKHLAEQGVKVTVATPDFVLRGATPAPDPPKLVPIPGVEHVVLETTLTPVYQKNVCMRYSIANFLTLVALIRRIRPDLVHGTQEASIQLLASACLLCDVPLIVSVHTDVAQIARCDPGFTWIGGAAGKLHKTLAIMCAHWGYRNWAFSGASYFCVSSQSNQILKDAGVRDSRVCPGSWGPMVDRRTFRIDLPQEEVAEMRRILTFEIPDAFLLVYVGRVTAEKDVQFLVDALERAPKRVVLALIGPGSMVEELKKNHGKAHRLHCTGELRPRENVASILKAADCCVSASVMETIGFTAMESLSCGTPCLMANAQGFALHLSHGVNARLFTPQSQESFDAELAALMAERREGCWSPESLRESMASASVEECTKRALQAYQFAGVARDWYFRIIPVMLLLVMQWGMTFFIV